MGYKNVIILFFPQMENFKC